MTFALCFCNRSFMPGELIYGAITALQDAGVPILMQAYPDEISKMDFKATPHNGSCGLRRIFCPNRAA